MLYVQTLSFKLACALSLKKLLLTRVGFIKLIHQDIEAESINTRVEGFRSKTGMVYCTLSLLYMMTLFW